MWCLLSLIVIFYPIGCMYADVEPLLSVTVYIFNLTVLYALQMIYEAIKEKKQ